MTVVLACDHAPASENTETLKQRPNILLIVADDLGYSDLGSYGSEIRTPVLDELAYSGVRFTNFHVAATCSPTRAMLMSGIDHHRAGLGNMAVWMAPNQRGEPGYEGHINNVVVPIPERLRMAGYHTYMAGKWHLGHDKAHWPAANGFERDLSLIGGAGSHFSDMSNIVPQRPKVTMTLDGERIYSLAADYFSTKNFTDFLIEGIKADRADDRPFFAFLALQVPHVPLQLPADWIDRNTGRYDKGYDQLRMERLARQKTLGIVDPAVTGAVGEAGVPRWQDLSENGQRISARKMEIYAGIVENMDHHIGRLMSFLSDIGELENTLVIFMSDNGPAAEDTRGFISDVMGADAGAWFDTAFNNQYENIGRPGSWIGYGPAWAQVSAVPFRLFKATLAEGGVRVPLVINKPGLSGQGGMDASLLSVTDLVGALLQVADGEPLSLQGRSADRPLGMELFGQRALISGEWKLLNLSLNKRENNWALYDIQADPAEQTNLATLQPAVLAQLVEQWEQYAKLNGVILPLGRKQPRPYKSLE